MAAMRAHPNRLVFSPSDLNTFFESPFASWMNRLHVERPHSLTPDAAGEDLALLAKMGIAHELRYLETLRARHHVWEPVASVPAANATRVSLDHAVAQTVAAMKEGHPSIYQGALAAGEFAGYSDFLYRVNVPSKLGPYSYEVGDTKLARKPKPYFMLQLCAYAKMLEAIQGVRPEYVYIVNGAGERLTFRTDDYFYYFEALERRFLEQQRSFDPNTPPFPDPAANHGRWQTHADDTLERADHLCRVANSTAHQTKRLAAAGITTLAQLATTRLTRIPKMDEAVFRRLRSQAQLQIASTGKNIPEYGVLPPDPMQARYGLALLPPVSPMDVYFDMEGYPLTEGGLEYLFGATHLVAGKPLFQEFWAHTRLQEKRAFEQFVDWVYSRFRADPTMHVFHYAAYEVSALRRLMGTHGTREHEVDVLLRAEVFIDLYRVVRQSLQIGERSYSLKKVEHLYRPARAGEVATAAQSVVEYARWVEEPDGATWESSAILAGIRDYNREDCESTWELRAWLMQRQAEAGIAYAPPPPKLDAAEHVSPRDEAEALAQRLLAAIPQDRTGDSDKWHVQELLAHVVGFHAREAKPVWWAMFDSSAKTHQELTEDDDCLGHCRRTKTPPTKVAQSFVYEYRFDPTQDTKLLEGRKALIAESLKSVSIDTLDRVLGLVHIKMSAKSTSESGVPDVLSLIPDDYVSAAPIAAAIMRIVQKWEAHGTLPPALDTFLRRTPPRINGVTPGAPLLGKHTAALDPVLTALAAMNSTAVAIQGPPGAGKTYIASRVIAELALRGFRIGITSNSHKAIEKVMVEVLAYTKSKRKSLRLMKLQSQPNDALATQGIVCKKSIRDVAFALPDAPQVVGGTAWAFSAPEAEGQFDYLFVDEAGQVSVANLTGMAASTKNIVLLGDPMQLSQPTQGAHPGESGASTLEYLMQDHRTIPSHLGIFLDTTRRMHPAVCSFISGAVYDGKLQADASTEARVVRKHANVRVECEAGIRFVPVVHEGNAQSSEEEVAAIAKLLNQLQGRTLEGDAKDRPRLLGAADVLVVAPYNAQVRAIDAAMDIKVGSVDKFQGQEAPVVIISMCASNGESSPRGLEFLLDPNRLNVAISRAESLAIVVGSPAIGESRVTSVAQMKLVNFFCRIVAEGTHAE